MTGAASYMPEWYRFTIRGSKLFMPEWYRFTTSNALRLSVMNVRITPRTDLLGD